jgi:hypothetical protein
MQGFKRANNILSQAEAKDGVEYSFGADVKFAETDEERALFAALDTAEATITPAMAAEDFATAMAAMAALRAPIDAFFTAVQVNSRQPGRAAEPAEPVAPHPRGLFRGGRPDADRGLSPPRQDPGRTLHAQTTRGGALPDPIRNPWLTHIQVTLA